MNELAYTLTGSKLYVELNGETVDTGVSTSGLQELCRHGVKDYKEVIEDVVRILQSKYAILSDSQRQHMNHNDLMFSILSRYMSDNAKNKVKVAPTDFGLSPNYGTDIEFMSDDELDDLCCIVGTVLQDICGDYFRSDVQTAMFYAIYAYPVDKWFKVPMSRDNVELFAKSLNKGNVEVVTEEFHRKSLKDADVIMCTFILCVLSTYDIDVINITPDGALRCIEGKSFSRYDKWAAIALQLRCEEAGGFITNNTFPEFTLNGSWVSNLNELRSVVQDIENKSDIVDSFGFDMSYGFRIALTGMLFEDLGACPMSYVLDTIRNVKTENSCVMLLRSLVLKSEWMFKTLNGMKTESIRIDEGRWVYTPKRPDGGVEVEVLSAECGVEYYNDVVEKIYSDNNAFFNKFDTDNELINVVCDELERFMQDLPKYVQTELTGYGAMLYYVYRYSINKKVSANPEYKLDARKICTGKDRYVIDALYSFEHVMETVDVTLESFSKNCPNLENASQRELVLELLYIYVRHKYNEKFNDCLRRHPQ